MHNRKTKTNEEIFIDHINTLIINLLINNKNFNNGVYTSLSTWDFIAWLKKTAQYLIDEIELTKHLVLDKDSQGA